MSRAAQPLSRPPARMRSPLSRRDQDRSMGTAKSSSGSRCRKRRNPTASRSTAPSKPSLPRFSKRSLSPPKKYCPQTVRRVFREAWLHDDGPVGTIRRARIPKLMVRQPADRGPQYEEGQAVLRVNSFLGGRGISTSEKLPVVAPLTAAAISAMYKRTTGHGELPRTTSAIFRAERFCW